MVDHSQTQAAHSSSPILASPGLVEKDYSKPAQLRFQVHRMVAVRVTQIRWREVDGMHFEAAEGKTRGCRRPVRRLQMEGIPGWVV